MQNITFSKRLTKICRYIYRYRILRNKYGKNTKILQDSNKRVQLLRHGSKTSYILISRGSNHLEVARVDIASTSVNVEFG